MLIVLSGLPASGKSELARSLAAALPATILDKDRVRAALFTPEQIEYSRRQDDFCMLVIYQTAAYLLRANPNRHVIIDGRPFAHAYQVNDLKNFFDREAIPFCLVECTCPEETARERLERDVAEGRHVARNRNFGLYQALRAGWDPITLPHLVVDTVQSMGECLRQCQEYIRLAAGDTRER